MIPNFVTWPSFWHLQMKQEVLKKEVGSLLCKNVLVLLLSSWTGPMSVCFECGAGDAYISFLCDEITTKGFVYRSGNVKKIVSGSPGSQKQASYDGTIIKGISTQEAIVERAKQVQIYYFTWFYRY